MVATERVALEPGWILHTRSYRETSGLVELLTPGHGRLTLVARGLKRSRNADRALLQPFRPLLVSWGGRGTGLATLYGAEPAGEPVVLGGAALMSGFYVNELLLRFLHKGDPHPLLHETYRQVLAELAGGDGPEAALRRFELVLLAEAGYGLVLDHDARTGGGIEPEAHYDYRVEVGPVAQEAGADPADGYRGAELLAISRGDLTAPATLATARRLFRHVIDHHLEGRPLQTRTVYAALRRQSGPH